MYSPTVQLGEEGTHSVVPEINDPVDDSQIPHR